MSGELKVLINEQEYENEILSFDKESIVIRLKGVRDRRIERVCFAGNVEFLKRITEKQIGILENLHENQSKRNILFGNFEGAERVPCSFEDNMVEQEQRQRDAVEFSVGVKDLFLIWGPPGTGKSTLVPEIIRNYLTRNSDAKILVCSYANGAVDRIVEIINDVFKGVINIIKSRKERLAELDKEEREHTDDAKQRKDSDLEDEKAKLEDLLNAKANELLPLIRRLNIIAKERFNRLVSCQACNVARNITYVFH
ncbi:ATP-dependent RecD-like DNA helicase, partial [ANME-1 cluster archaeon GoMg1]|nr:ATP-dependent RecD-like DNA helicase [ANME-1 cluster archaeon GoMg1]